MPVLTSPYDYVSSWNLWFLNFAITYPQRGYRAGGGYLAEFPLATIAFYVVVFAVPEHADTASVRRMRLTAVAGLLQLCPNQLEEHVAERCGLSHAGSCLHCAFDVGKLRSGARRRCHLQLWCLQSALGIQHIQPNHNNRHAVTSRRSLLTSAADTLHHRVNLSVAAFAFRPNVQAAWL